MLKYILIYTNFGNICDGLARIRCMRNTYAEVYDKMKADVEEYVKANYGKLNTEITRENDTYILIGNEQEGCQWQILEVNFIPDTKSNTDKNEDREVKIMKVLNNIEIIMIGSEVYYNYNGTLYTKERFEDIHFPHIDTSPKPQKEIENLFDEDGNICIKLQANDYVKFNFNNEYDEHVFDEGIIVYAEYDNNDRMRDFYKVKISNNLHYEIVSIYGRDIDRVWR